VRPSNGNAIVTHALCLLLGFAIAAALAWFLDRRRARAPALLAPPALALPQIAVGVSAELATLASGMEGNAQLLCEAAEAGEPIAPYADQLCHVGRRLRALAETIQLAAGEVRVHLRPVRVEDVVLAVQHELEAASCGRYQIAVDLASSVPEVATDARALTRTLLLLADVLVGREPGACKFTLRTRNSLAQSRHGVVLEMSAEVEENVAAEPPPPAQLTLAHEAADNLLEALGAQWTLSVERGVGAAATILLPAAPPEETAAPAPDSDPPARHDFGGALVLETDPAVRHMVGRELERTGRQVFLCADGVAARALWRATPERFELLVVAAQGGRLPGEALVAEALEVQPATRAVLLGHTAVPALQAAAAAPSPRVTVVPQPFGLMELRDALAHVGIRPSRATG